MFDQVANLIELGFDAPQRADVLLNLAIEVFVFSASNISRLTRKTAVAEAPAFRMIGDMTAAGQETGDTDLFLLIPEIVP